MSERIVIKEIQKQYESHEYEKFYLTEMYAKLMRKLESKTLSVDDTLEIYKDYNELSEYMNDMGESIVGPMTDKGTTSTTEEKPKSKLLTLQGWTPAILIVVVEVLFGFFAFEKYLDIKLISGLMFIPLLIYFAPALRYLFSSFAKFMETEKETYAFLMGECLRTALGLKQCAEFLVSAQIKKANATTPEETKHFQMRSDLLVWAQEKKRLRLIMYTQKIYLKAKKENVLLVRDLNETVKPIFAGKEAMPQE